MSGLGLPSIRLGWKTIAGAVVTAVGWLGQPQVLQLLPDKVAYLVTAAGAVLTAIGVRHALAKQQGPK